MSGRVRGHNGRKTAVEVERGGSSGADETVRTVLPAVAPSVAAARRFVAAAMRRHEALPEMIDTACLLTSELVTNALVHAGSRVELAVTTLGRGVRVEVGDASRAAAQPRAIGSEAVAGRGLHIVEAMSSRWGTNAMGTGKRVWFELDGAMS